MDEKQKQSDEFKQRRRKALRTSWGFIMSAPVVFFLLMFMPPQMALFVLIFIITYVPFSVIYGIYRWIKYKKDESYRVGCNGVANWSGAGINEPSQNNSPKLRPDGFQMATGEPLRFPQGQSRAYAEFCVEQFTRHISHSLPPRVGMFRYAHSQEQSTETYYVVNTNGLTIKYPNSRSIYLWIKIEGNDHYFRWELMVAEKTLLGYCDLRNSHFGIQPTDERVRNWSGKWLVIAKVWDFLCDTLPFLGLSKSSDNLGKERYSLPIINEATSLLTFVQMEWLRALDAASRTKLPMREDRNVMPTAASQVVPLTDGHPLEENQDLTVSENPPPARMPIPATWKCLRCGEVNLGEATMCIACNCPRMSQGE